MIAIQKLGVVRPKFCVTVVVNMPFVASIPIFVSDSCDLVHSGIGFLLCEFECQGRFVVVPQNVSDVLIFLSVLDQKTLKHK